MPEEEEKGKQEKMPTWSELHSLPHKSPKSEEKKEEDTTDYQTELSKKLVRGVDNLTAAEIYKKLISDTRERPAPQPASEPPFQIKGTMDISNMMASSNEMLKSMLESKDMALGLATRAKEDAEKRYWEATSKSIEDKINTLKEHLDKATQGKKQEDPIDVYRRVHSIFQDVREELAKSLGTNREALPDPRIAIELKRMEMDSNREMKKLEIMMEQDRRNFELQVAKLTSDDNRYWREFELKQQQQKDLIKEVSKGLESVAKIMEERGRSVASLVPAVCDNARCGFRFNIPSDAASVECPRCHTRQGVREEPASQVEDIPNTGAEETNTNAEQTPNRNGL